MMTISMCFAAHYTLEPLDFKIDQSKNSEEEREVDASGLMIMMSDHYLI